MKGEFQISQINRGYRFELVSSSGDILIHSGLFATRSCCAAAIQSLKVLVARGQSFQKLMKPNGQYYFIVAKENDEVLATSQLYWSGSSRDYAIMIIKREVPGAGIKSQIAGQSRNF